MPFKNKLVLFLLLALLPFTGGKAFAGATPGNATLKTIVISGDESSFPNLKGSIYLIEDQNKKLGFNSVITMIQNGQLARHQYEGSVVSLGTNANPFWMVLPVLNNSSRDIWLFDFGQASQGRFGFADKAILYEPTSRQSFFNTTLAQTHPGGPGLLSSKIPVSLKRGTTSFLIFYFEGHKGSLASFKPTLKPYIGAKNLSDFVSLRTNTLYLISVFILLTCFFFKRDYSSLSLAIMWLMFFFYGTLVNQFFIIEGILGQIAAPAFRILFPLLLLLSLGLTPDSRKKFHLSLFIGSALMSIICGALSISMLSISPQLGLMLSYVPVLVIATIITLVSLPSFSMRKYSNLTGLFLIAAAIIISNIWMALVMLGYLPSHETMTQIAPWITAFAAVASAVIKIKTSQVFSADRNFQEDSSFLTIREAREESEHKRLLQVLEQERSVMKELQLQEARQTEEMRKAKESADEANQAKSAFLAVVSHEIRTPMTGIMGMVRLMFDTQLSREQKEYASTIQDSGEALLALLNDILDFEKIESGKLELEITSFDLKRLLKGIQTLMNGHAASKNIDLVLDMDEKLPEFVMGDPTRLRQVLLNLVNNAIKFTSKGAVTIQVKNLSAVECNQSPIKQIYFGVQDSGIGITPEQQKKIFTPFSQADSSISRKFGGTGLGLAICKRLIEAMGAIIGINSREGEGSTFFFTLPMHIADTEDKSVRQAPTSGEYTGRKLRILVVDDNGINQKVLQGLLGKGGHQTVLASTGEEALAEVQKTTFDLVLMDVELPGMNGHQATRAIRALPNLAQSMLPVIAMTGNVRTEDVEACFEAGMNDFLPKPVMHENLQQILIKASKGAFTNQNTKPRSSAATEPAAPLEPVNKPEPVIPEAEIIFEETPLVSKADIDSLMGGMSFEDDEDDDFASAVKNFEEKEKKYEAESASLIQPPDGISHLDDLLVKSLVGNLGITQTLDLLKSFYESCEMIIEGAKQAYLAKDIGALAARAHELKGMASNFGFKSLAANAGQIEHLAKSNAEEAEYAPLLETLYEYYLSSRAEMDQRLKA